MKSPDTEKEQLAKDWPCKFCKEPTVFFTSDETYDGAYDRYHYHCHSCEKIWTVVAEYD